MKNRNDDILLRIAQADAYAAATKNMQFFPSFMKRARKLDGYLAKPIKPVQETACYGDDGQEAIAAAEFLLKKKRYSRESYIDSLLFAFKRDPRKGYYPPIQRIMDRNLEEPFGFPRMRTHKIFGATSKAVIFGLVPDLGRAQVLSIMAADVTHRDEFYASHAAQAVTIMSWHAHYTDLDFKSMSRIYGRRCPLFKVFQTRPWKGRLSVGRTSIESSSIKVAWAVHSILADDSMNSYEAIMEKVIGFGGNTDLAASIAWGIASARIKTPPPQFIDSDFEQTGSPYGTTFLRDLGKKLMIGAFGF